MNLYLLIASILAILIGIIHSILGERLILIPLLKKELPQILGSDWITKRTLRFAWHVTSICWWGMAFITLLFASKPLDLTSIFVLHVFAVVFFLSFLISLIGGRGRHFSWYVFLAITILLWVGAKPYP